MPKPRFSTGFYPNPWFQLLSIIEFCEILRFPHVNNVIDFLNANFPENVLYLLGIPDDVYIRISVNAVMFLILVQGSV